jgi:glycerate dehydrogenase
MKIVVLDSYTLNPGDLSWSEFEALGSLSVHERTPASQVADRASDAEVVLTNKTPIDKEVLKLLPRLQYIGVLATGCNVVDLEAAATRGVVVTNVPAYGTASVAQHVFALILEHCNHTGEHAVAVREGDWVRCPDFCFWRHPLLELEGLTMGIVGWGHIGQAVGRIAQAFGMNVLFHSRSALGSVDLETLFAKSDFVTLHCPLTEATKHMVNASRLGLMKPSAFLINTGRGGLVDEAALAQALNEGALAGAGLDVLSVEPPAANNPLLTAKNCLITPHQAWASVAARRRLMDIAVANLRGFLGGKPVNVVNSK